MDEKEKEPLLILVLGLPRSGSLAIHHFFTCNQIPSTHYCCPSNHSHPHRNSSTRTRTRTRTAFPCETGTGTCGECVYQNLKHARPAFHGCSSHRDVNEYYRVFAAFDVETSDPFGYFLPQHYVLPILHAQYPRALWILNQREHSHVWADSLLHWYSPTVRMLQSFGLAYDDEEEEYDENEKDHDSEKDVNTSRQSRRIGIGLPRAYRAAELAQALDGSIDRAHNAEAHARRRNRLIAMYETHADRVRSFVKAHHHDPRSLFLELNVDDPHAGQNLSQFFLLLQQSQSQSPQPLLRVKSQCWDANRIRALNDDWKNFSLPF